MNLDCHIIAVEDCGDRLRVRLQGAGNGDAEWRPMLPQLMEITNSGRAAKSFHIGRRVTITIEPK